MIRFMICDTDTDFLGKLAIALHHNFDPCSVEYMYGPSALEVSLRSDSGGADVLLTEIELRGYNAISIIAQYLKESILDGTEITDEELVSSVGLSMDDYYIKVEQALGSKYWEGWDRANEQFQNNSFCEMFNAQLENTISQENLRKALPYLNSEGQLCIIAPIYSMAGADYYYHELNLSDLTLIPDYKYGVEIQAHAINISQEEAYQIACDYWDFTPGDVADETGFELFVSYDTTITSQNSGKTYYCYLLRWMVDAGSDTAHLSTCDWVYIDAESGECSFEAPK